MSDALELLSGLVTESGESWIDQAAGFQRQDAEAILADPDAGPRRHFVIRPRGALCTSFSSSSDRVRSTRPVTVGVGMEIQGSGPRSVTVALDARAIKVNWFASRQNRWYSATSDGPRLQAEVGRLRLQRPGSPSRR